MAIMRSRIRPGFRRQSQRAPFPGGGAITQNAALSDALDPAKSVEEATPTYTKPPQEVEEGVVGPDSPINRVQPVGPRVPMVDQKFQLGAPTTDVKSFVPTAPAVAAKRGMLGGPENPLGQVAGAIQGDPDPQRAEIKRAYMQFTGRDPADAEVQTHLGGAGDPLSRVAGAVRNIFNSPEAQRFRAQGEIPPGPGNQPGAGGHRGLNPLPGQGAPPGLGAALGGAGTAPFVSGPGSGMPQGAHWDQDYRFTGDPAQFNAIPKGNFGWLAGYDQQKFDSDHNTMKYAFGRIASNYDPTQAGSLDAMMASPEFRALFPNAKKVGNNDKIDFGDGRPVDVWRNHGAGAGGGGDAWVWQTMDQAHMGGGGATGATPGLGTALTGGPTVSGGDTVSKLLQYLMGQLQI